MNKLKSKKTLVFAALAVLVLLKLIFYYKLMGVGTGFAAAVALSFVVIAGFFCIFRRKWIFGIIYTAFSLLMVIDVNYYSFFNRSLSITQLGAADLLGGVTQSIKELFMPVSLLLLVDAILFIVLPLVLWPTAKKPRTGTSCEAGAENEAGTPAEADAESKADSLAKAAAENEASTPAEATAKNKTDIPYGAAAGEDRTQTPEDSPEESQNLAPWEKPVWRLLENRKFRIASICVTAALVAASVLIVPAENSYASSVFSQEYFSYHLRDITGINPVEKAVSYDGLYDAGGTYEKEIKGEDFGVAEGMNLIMIQIEAMQNFVIGREYNGQEITPFINSLLEEDTYYFDTFYQQTGSGNTSDAEFAANTSLYGTRLSYTYALYNNNYWRGLPALLKEDGYSTSVFHAYDEDYWSRADAYPGMGLDTFYSVSAFDPVEEMGMGLSDEELFKQSMEIIAEQNEPFYDFIITLSSHYPFYITRQVDIEIEDEDKDTLFGHYIEAMSYVDHCLELFFDELKESGQYDNTMVVIYGDHLGMNPKTEDVQQRMSEYLGWNYDYEDAMNVPLVIHVPGSGEHETITTAGGQTDILPTIWYLMGKKTLDTVYFGHNLLTVKNNFVPLKSYLPEGSFVYGDCIFKMSQSGLVSDGEVVNLRTHKKDSIKGLDRLYSQSLQMQNTSEYFLENDVLRRIYEDGETMQDIIIEEGQEGYYSEIDYQETVVDGAQGEGVSDGLYCFENLEKLYKSGTRAFYLNMVYTSDMFGVALHDLDELDKYFTKASRIYNYESLKIQQSNKAVTPGLTIITMPSLIEWMKSHKDTYFYISLDSSQIIGANEDAEPIPRKHFTRSLQANYPEQFARMILVANDEDTLIEYGSEQLHNVILYNDGSLTPEEVIEDVNKFGIYGAAMDIRSVQSLMDIWVFDDVAIYGMADERSKRLIEKLKLDGCFIFDRGSSRTERYQDDY